MSAGTRLWSPTEVDGDDSHRWAPWDPAKPESERDRFIAAFGKAASEHGYRDLTFEQVARYAGAPAERLEFHFANKEEGLVAAQDAFLNRLWLDVLEICEAPGDWPIRVRAALTSVITTLAEASTLARVFTIEATAASFAAAERQFAALDSFARLLGDGRRLYPRAAELPAATERVLIGGIASMITVPLLAEEPQALLALEPQLVELVLVPFVGAGRARQVAGS
jgi:AcrR family transcriptional regulator